MYTSRKKARRAKPPTHMTPSPSLQASREESVEQPVSRARSPLEQSGSLLEKIWGPDTASHSSRETPTSALQAKPSEARQAIDYSYVHIQRRPAAKSDRYPPPWMRQPLPALSAPLQASNTSAANHSRETQRNPNNRDASQSQPASVQLKSEQPDSAMATTGENHNAPVQRLLWNSEENYYYSEASPSQKGAYRTNNPNDAFITVTSSGGGHSTLWLETFELQDGGGKDYRTRNWQVELLADGEFSYSRVAVNQPEMQMSINVDPLNSGQILRMTGTEGEGEKKTWKVTAGAVRSAIAKAEEIKAKVESGTPEYYYNYSTHGISGGSAMNCAYFAELVLQAAGIQTTSANWANVRLPSKLTKMGKRNSSGAITEVDSIENLEAVRTDSQIPEQYRTQRGIVRGASVPSIAYTEADYDDNFSQEEARDLEIRRSGHDRDLRKIAQSVEHYHLYSDHMAAAEHLYYAMVKVAHILNERANIRAAYASSWEKHSGKWSLDDQQIQTLMTLARGLRDEARVLDEQLLAELRAEADSPSMADRSFELGSIVDRLEKALESLPDAMGRIKRRLQRYGS